MSDTTEQKRSYKKTLNLPKTAFSMKANLVQNEPASLKRWDKDKLYQQLRQAEHPAGPFVFHDGPPYANGSIHLGHLLNKVLKDFVVRSRTMAGYDVPYIPGWDCHGLPIEHKVMQELGPAAKEMDAIQIRRKCKSYAQKFVKLQSQQMQRLLTLADYDDPYLTMNPKYEAAVLEVFADLVSKGLVYRGLKPVHWSIENQTALAEAELEYYDVEDTSIYVLFEVEKSSRKSFFDEFELEEDDPLRDLVPHFLVWTTTPWTLPANMAIAVNATCEYSLVKWRGILLVIATELVEHVKESTGISGTEFTPAGKPADGASLYSTRYRHPFIERSAPVVMAPYVMLDEGTGLVHTAPGHGSEDFATGVEKNLYFGSDENGQTAVLLPDWSSNLQPEDVPPSIYSPVRDDGTFDDTVSTWLQGKLIWDANDLIITHLQGTGNLFASRKISHSYPHDWRGKTRVIFRATEQWFLSVDREFQLDKEDDARSLRGRTLDVVNDNVTFYPRWGQNRLRGMLEGRPDWCLSRQRSWGLPIPVFYFDAKEMYHRDGESGVTIDSFSFTAGMQTLCTPAVVRIIAKVFSAPQGSDAWFRLTPEELLAEYDYRNDPDVPTWVKNKVDDKGWGSLGLRKSTDIFDVWFESGSSWHAVMRQRGLGYDGTDREVTDLYLEGSDQHRGWFQSSLLPAVAVTGRSPFKAVLTHGFMVDKHGHKMSKSLGNTLEVEELLKTYGADVCRWWVSSLNSEGDIKVDESFFKVAGEEYRKVRNTLRFLLSNLGDFDPLTDRYQLTDADAASVDMWVRNHLHTLSEEVQNAYNEYAFRRAHERLFLFCSQTLSAFYLATVKDRLYCDKPDSQRRRRTQTAIFDIADVLIRLLAPLMPHTAEEAWAALHGEKAGSVHLETFAKTNRFEPASDKAMNAMNAVMTGHETPPETHALRDDWLKAIEDYRQANDIDNPLDLGLRVAGGSDVVLQHLDPRDLADICGISFVEVVQGDAVVEVLDLRDQPRCERSWKRDGTVKQRSDGGMLSDRDAKALGL